MSALYLHIPYCKSRCIYCDFYTTASTRGYSAFVQALCGELVLRSKTWAKTEIQTIYVGGGTPSQLSIEELAHIFKIIEAHYQISNTAEITIEANPDDLTEAYVAAMRQHLPVNRISMGLQTFDNQLLRLLNRRHTAEEAEMAVKRLMHYGYTNLSIDLIYGLPNQTLEAWQHDVARALCLPIKHLSAYALIYEPGTPLMRMKAAGKVHEADDALSLAMFEHLIDATQVAGLQQYEISNFAREGYHSRHNTTYWQGKPYVACGPSAHGYDGMHRYYNTPRLASYIKAMGDVEGQGLQHIEVLSIDEQYNDFVLTRLRTMAGLNTEELVAQFGTDYLDYALQEAQTHLQRGHLEHIGNVLRLTRNGIFVSDTIMADLMRVDD
ncbi:MAG: radical SAM family heme chaperone HemW [Bacteroidales bacterium]|nr:radical SAM family heme chaperone HemW [Bacteroidales bacterium]